MKEQGKKMTAKQNDLKVKGIDDRVTLAANTHIQAH